MKNRSFKPSNGPIPPNPKSLALQTSMARFGSRPRGFSSSLMPEKVKKALVIWINVFVGALWLSQACLSVSHKRVSSVRKNLLFALTILQPV